MISEDIIHGYYFEYIYDHYKGCLIPRIIGTSYYQLMTKLFLLIGVLLVLSASLPYREQLALASSV